MEATTPQHSGAAWAAPLRWARQGRGRTPAALLVVSAAVALLVLAPVGFLFDQTFSTGWDEVRRLLFRPFVGRLLVNTTTLVAVGTLACTILGVAVAWFVERTDLPGRRAWAVLAALPITVPAFVTSYSWVSITPAVQGFWGAAAIVTLAYYPLVYLPVAAVLRGMDPALEESARSLGMGPWRTFFRVTLPQTRVALLGGMLLVSVHMLAEFGAFAMLRFQTFTTAIYDQYKLSFDGAAASMLASVLVLLCLVLLVAELAARGRGRYARVDSGSARPPRGRPPRQSQVGGERRLPGADRARPRPAAGHPRLLGGDRQQRLRVRPRVAAGGDRRLAEARPRRRRPDHAARPADLDPLGPPPEPRRDRRSSAPPTFPSPCRGSWSRSR